MEKQPTVFISYSWDEKKFADKIYFDLTTIGVKAIKDDHSVKYSEKISDFMEQIRTADIAIVLLSDSFLKSINCMNEIMNLSKDRNMWEKVFIVRFQNANIFTPLERISYVNYWQAKSTAIQEALKTIDPINATSLYSELKDYKGICENIDVFLTQTKDRLHCDIEKLIAEFYRPLFDKFALTADFSNLYRLIEISRITPPEEQLAALNKYKENYYYENTEFYSILASCFKALGRIPEAIEIFNKALEFDHLNFSAWNNLGQAYQINENYEAAIECYNRAIEAQPKFDIPRLNLGNIYDRYRQFDKAKEQFEEIIRFDKNNPKAHNNLANIYRTEKYKNLTLAEYHFKIAVSQNLVEAMISYGNFLHNQKEDIEKGNEMLNRAKSLDLDGVYTEIIDALLKMANKSN